jgi:hypothetical protein
MSRPKWLLHYKLVLLVRDCGWVCRLRQTPVPLPICAILPVPCFGLDAYKTTVKKGAVRFGSKKENGLRWETEFSQTKQ